MQEFYFLLGLGLIWSVFAVVQDFKTREVSNWLNFSLVVFGLTYRGFYALGFSDVVFFISGLVGFVIFFIIAHLFYYGRVFAGGDAKLLMGFGVILPYRDFLGLFYVGVSFILILFFLGAIWSFVYSVFVVNKNWDKFRKEFKKVFRKSRFLFFALFIVIILTLLVLDLVLWVMFSGFLVFVLFLYFYVRALDVCMLVMKDARELQEGDWLEKDVRVGKNVIKKSVHGLSSKDIKILQKVRKKVLIKDGIPFTVSFLLALVVIGYLFLIFDSLSFDFFGKLFNVRIVMELVF